jgi:ribosomal protein S18 acetylase RimI-like enzyme
VSEYQLRDAGPADTLALSEALVEAANWDSRHTIPRVGVLSDPIRSRYLAGWPRPGDGGVVAETPDGVEVVGAAWYRLLAADRPGLGYVATGVPELTLGVRPMWRAQGVGRALLQALLRKAAAAGYARISLSVERGNFAQRLYRSEGFTVLSSKETADVMVRSLN